MLSVRYICDSNYFHYSDSSVGRGSSVLIATRYGLDAPGIESRWRAIFSAPVLLYNGDRVSFPGVKRAGRGVEHPPPSGAEVKERVELFFYSPSGSSWPVVGRTSPFLPLLRVWY